MDVAGAKMRSSDAPRAERRAEICDFLLESRNDACLSLQFLCMLHVSDGGHGEFFQVVSLVGNMASGDRTTDGKRSI